MITGSLRKSPGVAAIKYQPSLPVPHCTMKGVKVARTGDLSADKVGVPLLLLGRAEKIAFKVELVHATQTQPHIVTLLLIVSIGHRKDWPTQAYWYGNTE